jgi:hypothetical protein
MVVVMVVVVTFVIVVVCGVVVTCSSFIRNGLNAAFEGFSRTQSYAFQARQAPIELPFPQGANRK